MPISSTTPYTTIENVLNLVRAMLNDTQAGATGTPGEGRVFTDGAPFVIPFLNAAISELQRRLQISSLPNKTKDVFLSAETPSGPVLPINSLQGVGVPNPVAQQRMDYFNFFDGLQSYQNPLLPYDCLVPTTIFQRQSGTNLPFILLPQAQGGHLPSMYQNTSLGQWQWRNEGIYFNGSIYAIDIHIYYEAAAQYFSSTIPIDQYPITPIPIRDSTEAIASLMASKFVASRSMPGATVPDDAAIDKIIMDMANRNTRAMQNRVFTRQAFGDEGGLW